MKGRLIVVGIVLSLFLLSGIGGETQFTIKEGVTNERVHSPSVLYSIQAPQATAIAVDGNSDFKTQAETYNWDAGGTLDGSAEKPFLIATKVITTGIGGKLIYIRNTNLFFEIYKCTLQGESYGIHLENVSNGHINDNSLEGQTTYGIRVTDGSSNINITDNEILDTAGVTNGIATSSTNLSIISGNTVSASTGYGFYLTSSDYLLVSGNTIRNTRYYGVYLNGDNNTLTGNTISLTTYAISTSYGNGIRVGNSINTTISNNVIHSTIAHGIHLTGTTLNSTIKGNEIYNSTIHTWAGGIIHWSDSANSSIITDNYIYDCRNGISGSQGNTFRDNIIHNCTGAGLSIGSWSTAENNTITKCGDGISVAGENSTLILNKIYNSTSSGIQLNSGSANHTLIQNTLEDNGVAVFIYGSIKNSMIDNILRNNSIYLWTSNYLHYVQGKMSNNLIDNRPLIFWQNMHGGIVPSDAAQVFLVDCSNIEITNLQITAERTGIVAAYSTYLNIHDNIVNSTWGALKLDSTNHSQITNNKFFDCDPVIYGRNVNNVTFANNLIQDSRYPIDLDDVNDSIFIGNQIYDCIRSGIVLDGGYNNIIRENVIHNLSITGSGITLVAPYNTSISFNSISNCSDWGIRLYWSDYNTIFANEISNCTSYGISVDNSNWNIIMYNTFSDNNPGFSQGYDTETTNLVKHNWWKDATGLDGDSNGTLDDPYALLGGGLNSDPLPLTDPYQYVKPTVVYPNGGESLTENVTIQWDPATDSLGHSFTYSLFYSLNGIVWVEIASDLSGTTYKWSTFGLTNSSTYLLTVAAVYHPVTYNQDGLVLTDISDNHFTIGNVAHTLTPPTITSPTSGERVSGIISIQWDASIDTWHHSFAIEYDVYYSADGGGSWTFLGTTPSTSDLWDTTTVSDGLNYKIRIVASNTEALSRTAISSTFTVQNHLLSTPIVVSPDGGETLSDTVTIQWTTSTDSLGHAVNYSVYYSDDGGFSWTLIAEGLEVNETIWDTTTVADGSDYLIQIVVFDELGFTNEDFSDSTFTIYNDLTAPVIVILNPLSTIYSQADLALTFTLDEPTTWIGYSLDGLTNVTITGNITLMSLSEGSHTITVYAIDESGNVGISATVEFTVEFPTETVPLTTTMPPNTTEPIIPETTPPVESTSEVIEETSTETSTTEGGGAPGWTGFSLLLILGVLTFYRRRQRNRLD